METVSPILNTLNTPFWRAAAEGRLVLPFCETENRAFWPPSPVSPFVTGGPVAWREVAPAGTLRTIAIYRRVFHKAFASLMPYGVGLIELDAGPRLLAHIATPDAADAPHSGDRVRIHFERIVETGDPVPVARK